MPHINPNYQATPEPNNSVPSGHRAKCRRCGAVDNVSYRLQDKRKAVCGACGGSLARRRAPKAPKVISYVVVRQLNGEAYGDVSCIDQFSAEREALRYCERGPVARSRVAAIIELLDDARTGNVRVLSYSNYKQRRAEVVWSGGCEGCKGKGLIGVRVPAKAPDKSVVKYVACELCKGLGGELTRRVMLGRSLK